MPTFPRGAIPTPQHKLLALTPFAATTVAPTQFAAVPPKLSMWLNDEFGVCVTTEEAFGKAVYSIMCGLPETFVPDAEVYRFASKYGLLNGTTLTGVMDLMKGSDGLASGGTLYHDGGYRGVDYSNELLLMRCRRAREIIKDGSSRRAGAGHERTTAFLSADMVRPDTCTNGSTSHCRSKFRRPCPAICYSLGGRLAL